jgi:hypothetical protein
MIIYKTHQLCEGIYIYILFNFYYTFFTNLHGLADMQAGVEPASGTWGVKLGKKNFEGRKLEKK